MGDCPNMSQKKRVTYRTAYQSINKYTHDRHFYFSLFGTLLLLFHFVSLRCNVYLWLKNCSPLPSICYNCPFKFCDIFLLMIPPIYGAITLIFASWNFHYRLFYLPTYLLVCWFFISHHYFYVQNCDAIFFLPNDHTK